MTVHVYPEDDWIDHKTDQTADECDCPCDPRIEYLDPQTGIPHATPMVIHNAIDQREKDEPDYRPEP